MSDGCPSMRPGATGGKHGVRTHKDPAIAQAVSDSVLFAVAASVQARVPATKATLRGVLGSSRRLRLLGCRTSCEVASETRRWLECVRSAIADSVSTERRRYELCMRAVCSMVAVVQLVDRGRSCQLELIVDSEFWRWRSQEKQGQRREITSPCTATGYQLFVSCSQWMAW